MRARGRRGDTAPQLTTDFWRCIYYGTESYWQIEAGKATPAPPVGLALGQKGVNIMAFTKEFNERTKNQMGYVIPVVITVYADRSFSFITKTPPAAVLIKKAAGINTAAQVEEIAKTKMPDLNAASLEAACSMVRGTCRSMGVVVEG